MKQNLKIALDSYNEYKLLDGEYCHREDAYRIYIHKRDEGNFVHLIKRWDGERWVIMNSLEAAQGAHHIWKVGDQVHFEVEP